MARSYTRDSKGRFAPTGGVKVTAVGAGRRSPNPLARVRQVGNNRVIESRSAQYSIKGRVKGKNINLATTNVARVGTQVSKKGRVTPVRSDAYVSKLKKTGYSKNAPSHRVARRVSGVRGAGLSRTADYVSRRESLRIPGGNRRSRSLVQKLNQTGQAPTSGYIVSRSTTRLR